MGLEMGFGMPGPGSSDARMRKATATTSVSPVIGKTGRPNEGKIADDVLRMIGTAWKAVRV